MRSLLDIRVLIAMLDSEHVHHTRLLLSIQKAE